MKKKIIIGLSLLLLAILGFFGYGILFPKSPPTSASFSDKGLDIKVTYSQPSKRDRLIFGEEKDGALQPYGKYWRLGANAPTEITFSKDITFGAKPVSAGTYRMYAVPGADSFQISLNSEVGLSSGSSEPDYALDVVKVDVPVITEPTETEKFTIRFASEASAITMDFVWDKIIVSVPITVQ